MLTDDTTIAIWQNECLPSDRMSIENATILTNSDRWPLIIDPQLQGNLIRLMGQDLFHLNSFTSRCEVDQTKIWTVFGNFYMLKNI